jgi:tripartite-type tricarboxylate transporter receptor subunit TctC
MGGQITMRMGTFFFAVPFVKSQRVRALAVTSPSRMPNVAGRSDRGRAGIPRLRSALVVGHRRPALTPKPILNQMHAELGKVLARTDVKTKLDQLGATVHASSPDEFVRLIRTEMQLWSKVIRDAKIGQE